MGHTASNQVVPDHGFRFIPTYVGHTILDSKDEAIASGSSPHTWGILWSHPSVQFNMRFIPTYVGHTLHVAVQGGLIRFIPTYVGHTSSNKAPMMPVSVHPHIRGAYFPADARKGRFGGSSPHTWGILPYIVFGIGNDRFIPTYVGHTYSQN